MSAPVIAPAAPPGPTRRDAPSGNPAQCAVVRQFESRTCDSL